MQDVTTPPDWDFIGRDYLQHDPSKWCDNYCLRNHIHLIAGHFQLKEGITIENESSLRIVGNVGKMRPTM